MRSPGKHCLVKAMCEQLLLWAPVDNLNTSLQWKTIAHEFYLHSCTVRQVFCLFTLYSVFLVGKLLDLWWVVTTAISRKFLSNFSSSDQCFSCHKLFKLECYGQRISQEFHKLFLLWITLHLKRVCFDCPVNTANWALKFSAIRNLFLTMIRLTRNFLVIEIVSHHTKGKCISLFTFILLGVWTMLFWDIHFQ